jgi:hypothetical protein
MRIDSRLLGLGRLAALMGWALSWRSRHPMRGRTSSPRPQSCRRPLPPAAPPRPRVYTFLLLWVYPRRRPRGRGTRYWHRMAPAHAAA